MPVLCVAQHLGWEKARAVCHPSAAVRLYGTEFFMGWEPAERACSPASKGTEGLNVNRTSPAGAGG